MVQHRESDDLSVQFRHGDLLLGIVPDRVDVIPQLIAEARLENFRFPGHMDVVDLFPQYVNPLQILLPRHAHLHSSLLPAHRGRPVAAEHAVAGHITDPLLVPAALAADPFLLHSCLFHYPAGLWIVHIMTGRNPVDLRCIEQIIHHCPQGFRHDSPAPESPAQAVSDLRLVRRFLQPDHGDSSDHPPGFLPLNRPVKITAVGIPGNPVCHDLSGHIRIRMGRPGQVLCHLKIRRPVVKHIFRICLRKRPQYQPAGIQPLRSGLLHRIRFPSVLLSGTARNLLLYFSLTASQNPFFPSA